MFNTLCRSLNILIIYILYARPWCPFQRLLKKIVNHSKLLVLFVPKIYL